LPIHESLTRIQLTQITGFTSGFQFGGALG